MERIVIQELERTLRLTRADMLSYSSEGLVEMGKLIESAALAIALESYSRDLEALRNPQPVLA
jgi:hypothetical protein